MTHLPLYPSDFLIACSLLLLSATFSCSESVLFALPRYVVRRLGENPHHPITRLLSDQRRLLSILLVGNMFVNLLFSAFALLVALRFFPSYSAFVLAELIAFVALVIFGEMTPKFVALLSPVFMSKLVAYPLLYISFILRIPAKVLDKTARLFTSPLARRVKKGEDDRLISLIRGAEQDRIIDPYEAQLLGQILRLRDKRVRQIVTPRMRVVGCDINTPRSDILKILQETGYRKLPVFDKDIENILGILHAKDIYLYPHLEVKELIRKPIFVPDRQPLDLFLRTLIARSETHAIVVDEYGSVVGLATLEDAVEEIIGEIEDEHDRSQAKIQFLETGRYLVSGECDIGIWEQVTGELLRTNMKSLSDYLVEKKGGPLLKGDVFSDERFRYSVVRTEPDVLILAEKAR